EDSKAFRARLAACEYREAAFEKQRRDASVGGAADGNGSKDDTDDGGARSSRRKDEGDVDGQPDCETALSDCEEEVARSADCQKRAEDSARQAEGYHTVVGAKACLKLHENSAL